MVATALMKFASEGRPSHIVSFGNTEPTYLNTSQIMFMTYTLDFNEL